ncbi:hypothetical protein A2767_04290 [Candidatus Roizmanbacteria bacterium RIFCSPHIGHO2_01_FULL_35_10]|uniref:Type II secretion system protein GspG C-terminal domain-containing protein n=1 Tax=Candidatus Roizmanbacteria bacterium RIFCSPLOWO2_01_FULL_35_13 TaxID=1802055 RepID=A0A1F7I8G2_9BACT|nr:MAG: hypothetical protein A2767_04290 [Candidatus Roizmanbacteria bacterium RIFCSPHIGHO2_01_FULL_35_10]OGK39648.1 MAG: hypothetical protein A3A74_07735 [Candidatus Roizmanbacteria bacterium RIFCSPLOWO2_01_FULL_35_13]
MLKKAFTLVELLIVIAIIGILAIGILIALDPVEQTRKATDSATLSTVGEVKGAIARHFVSRTCWPWQTLSAGVCSNAAGCANGTAYSLGGAIGTCGRTISDTLVDSGELKSYSGSLVSVLVNDGSATAWQVSFQPVSKSIATNSVLKYTTSACAILAGTGATGICAAPGAACIYCISQ